MSETPSASSRFDDGKAPDAMRTIGEVAAAVGIKPHVLRYWEQQFPDLQPLKRSGGRRLYRAEDIALVQRIDRLVNQQGYTLKGARSALLQGGEGEDVRTSDSDTERVDRSRRCAASPDVLVRLYSIRNRLSAALAE